jgi:hypothetical protein
MKKNKNPTQLSAERRAGQRKKRGNQFINRPYFTRKNEAELKKCSPRYSKFVRRIVVGGGR